MLNKSSDSRYPSLAAGLKGKYSFTIKYNFGCGCLAFPYALLYSGFFFLSPYLSFSKYYSSVKTKCPSRYYSSHKTFIKFHFYYNYLCGYYGKPFPVYLIIVSSKFLHIVQVEWILVIQENNKII